MRSSDLVEFVVGVGGRRVFRARQHGQVRRVTLQGTTLTASTATPVAALGFLL